MAQSCLIVLVTATVAGADHTDVTSAFIVVPPYFTGTVLYVKTTIREREDAAYYRMSVACHVFAVRLAFCLGIMLAALFTALFARAAALPRRPLTPKQVDVIEIGCCVLVLVAIATA